MHYGEVIRGADNRTVKDIRSLRQRQVREAERAFVVEGRRAVEDAVAAGGRPRVIGLREGTEWPGSPFDNLIRIFEARLFDRLAETETPQGVLAVFDLPEVRRPPGTALVLVADGISDPGNLGTLIRGAAAAGATSVVVTPGTVDPFNGKVVRSAVGAHFRIPIFALAEVDVPEFIAAIPHRLLAESTATTAYDQVDLRRPLALIIGSEAHGPTAFGRSLATQRIRVPLANEVESLNAAMAGTILLFEAQRQRRQASFGDFPA